MMIYGNEYAQSFNQLFPRIYEATKKIVPMNKAKRRKYERSMSRKTGLAQKLTKKYISKKTWLGMFGETNLSMIFSPLPEEIPFDYGEQIFTPMEPIEVSATISDTTMGFAYPAIYGLENVEIMTKRLEEINQTLLRVFSFEGAFTGYFKEGEEVVIRGLLEKVVDKKRKKSFHQIILGTKECQGNEFIIYKEDYPKTNHF
jgi:predicted nucleotidyltransferase